jgi:hypothetical protein
MAFRCRAGQLIVAGKPCPRCGATVRDVCGPHYRKVCDSHDALVDVAEEVLASATVETPEKLLAMARAALEAAKK